MDPLNLDTYNVLTFLQQQQFHLDLRPIVHFIVFTFLNCPPNVLWQDFLESTFPGYTLQSRTIKKSDAKVLNNRDTSPENAEKTSQKGWTEEIRVERRLDITNTAAKFLLDQTLGAAVNTVFFIAVMAALNGASSQEVMTAVKKVFAVILFPCHLHMAELI